MASFLDTKIHENVESPPSLAVVHVAPATTTARPPPSSFYTFRWGFLQKREINILFFFFPVFPLGRNSLSFLRAILLNKQVHPFKLQRKEVNAERACVLLSCSIPEKPPSNCSFFPSRTLPPTDRLSPCHQRCAWLPPPPPPSSPPSPLIIEQPFPLYSSFLLHHHLCLPLPTLPLLRTQKQTIRQNPSPFSSLLIFSLSPSFSDPRLTLRVCHASQRAGQNP